MTDPGWGVHNFELALRRWWRDYSPDLELVDRLRRWRADLEAHGIITMEPWALMSDDDFVGRIPGTPTIVSGLLIPYEQLVIVRAVVGA